MDTGSAVTIIHRGLWERGRGAAGHRSTLQQASGGPIVVANGESLSILGQTTSRIHVAGEEYTHDVLVADDVSQDCLLGADFLASHQFVIDLGSRMLRKGKVINTTSPTTQPDKGSMQGVHW